MRQIVLVIVLGRIPRRIVLDRGDDLAAELHAVEDDPAVRYQQAWQALRPGGQVWDPHNLTEDADLGARLAAAERVVADFAIATECGFGRRRPEDAWEPFGMTPLAMRFARSVNGVSRKHGEVCRQMFRDFSPEREPAAV